MEFVLLVKQVKVDKDCQQFIQVILNAHDAIRAVDQDNHVAQKHANEAR